MESGHITGVRTVSIPVESRDPDGNAFSVTGMDADDPNPERSEEETSQ